MKIILKQRVEKLGQAWDVVKVKDGFARNYLFPRGLALEATKGNLKVKESQQASKADRIEKEKSKAEALAQKLEMQSFTLASEATADDKLYGSVDALELAKFLSSEGYEIDRKNILLDEPIKSLGVYNVDIKLHPEVITKIKVWIVKK